jgi:hypothetical protein
MTAAVTPRTCASAPRRSTSKLRTWDPFLSPFFVTERTRSESWVPTASPTLTGLLWKVTGAAVHIFGSVEYCHSGEARWA